MGKSVDSRILEMTFDNKSFESNMKTSLSTLLNFEKGMKNLDGASAGLDNLEKSVSKVDFSPMSKGIDGIKVSFSALEILALDTLIKIKDKALEAGSALVKALTIDPMKSGWDEYELKMGSIQTIMAGTGESLDTVNKYLNELNKYSDDTIYSFADMTQNIGKFTNAGLSLKTSVGAIKGVANAAALSGANANEASRAMYNFAQALSAGHVKLIDWKSIENANMATVEFKTQLMESAVAAGTLEKTADGMYKVLTTSGQGSSMEETISATKNFNDSLQFQWMTTEALTNALNDYADETTDIGRRATKAATEVKTFSMLIDALGEAIQSSWASTWEIIIGDFTEGVALWTEISDVLGGLISKSSDARNDALQSGLKDIKEFATGIDGAAMSAYDFTKALEGTHVKLLNWKSIENAGLATIQFKEGLLEAGVAAGTLEKQSDGMYKVLSKNASGGTMNAVISATDNFNESLQYQWMTTEILSKSIEGLSGRDHLLAAMRNSFAAIASIAKPIQEAFSNVFSPITGQHIYDMAKGLSDFTAKLKLSDTASENLKSTFQGVFSIVSILGKVLKGVGTALSPLLGLFGSLSGNAISLTGSLGDNIKAFNDWLTKTDAIGKAAKIVADALQIFVDILKTIVDAIVGFITGAYSFEEALGKIKSAFKNVVTEGGPLEKLLGSLKDAFGKVKDSVSGFIEKHEGLSNIINTVKTAFGKLIEKFKTPFKSKSFADMTQNIGKFTNAGLSLKTSVGAIKGVANAAEETSTTLEKLSGIVSKVKEALGKLISSIVTNLKHLFSNINGAGILSFLRDLWELIKNVGKAVIDIVGNIFGNIDFNKLIELLKTGALVSLIPTIKGFIEGLSGIGGIGASITGMFDALSDGINSFTKKNQTKILETIAKSILMLAGALLVLSMIDPERMASSLGAITGLMIELVGATTIMNKLNEGHSIGAKGLVSFSASLVILSAALKIISGIDSERLWPSVAALGALMLELVAVTAILSQINTKNVKISTIVEMMGIAIAIKMLTKPLVEISALDWDSLARGLVGVGAVMLELTVSIAIISAVKTKNALGKALELIALATTIKILAGVVEELSLMDWEGMVKGLSGVGALITMLTLFVKLTGSTKNMTSVGVGLIAVGAALKIISGVVLEFAGYSWEELGRGLAGLAGALLSLSVSMVLMPKNMISIGVGLTIVGAALKIVATVVKNFSGYSWDELGRGIGGLAGALLSLTIPLKILSSGGSTLTAATSLLILSVAIKAFTPALKELAMLSVKQLAIGLTALAGAFTVMGVAAFALQGVIGVILGLALAFTMIGTAVLAFGAGVAILLAAFEALAIGGSVAAVAIVKSLEIIILGLATIIPRAIGAFILSLGLMAKDIATGLTNLLIEVVNKAKDAIPTLVSGLLELLLQTLKGLEENIGPIVESLFNIIINLLNSLADKLPTLIDSGVNFFAQLFSGIMDALAQADPGMLSDALKGFLSIAGIMAVAAGMSLIAAAAMKGIIAMGLVAIELTAVLAILGGIQSIPGVSELADKGGELLGAIGNAIGLFIGSMIGGFGEGVTNSLPAIATNLSDFITNLKPFLDGASKIDDSLFDGMDTLVSTILQIGRASCRERV